MPFSIFEEANLVYSIGGARDYKPRGSNIPICPSAVALDLWSRYTKIPLVERSYLKNEMFYRVGEAVHRTWQEWLGNMGVLYGYWYCDRCERIDLSFQRQCPTCYAYRSYKEITVSDPFGIRIDAPLRTPGTDAPDGKVNAIAELKTCSPRIWDEKRKPSVLHATQAHCCAEVLLRMGHPIDSAAVMYVSRDRPWEPKTFLLKPRKMLDWVVETYETAKETAMKGVVTRHNPPHDDSCTFCQWRTTCYSPIRNKLFKQLAKEFKNARSRGYSGRSGRPPKQYIRQQHAVRRKPDRMVCTAANRRQS